MYARFAAFADCCAPGEVSCLPDTGDPPSSRSPRVFVAHCSLLARRLLALHVRLQNEESHLWSPPL